MSGVRRSRRVTSSRRDALRSRPNAARDAGSGVPARSAMAHARWLWLAFLVAGFAWLPSPLRADGAFADSQVILLPRAQPHRIIASSDIAGLVVSDDDGASWSWICEGAIGYFAALFQLGPAPDESLYAITQAGLARSSDAGCSWQHADGSARHAGDVFPDASDPQHVFAIAQVSASAESPLLSDIVCESNDGGLSFGPAKYSTSSASLTGVEVARSDPSIVYLTMSSLKLQHPYIVRSQDGGASWTEQDLSSQLDRRPWVIRILTVDPADADTLYIRLSDGVRDALAITHDGGATLQLAEQLDTRMTAFLLRSDGALIVAAADATSFISSDGGASFAPWSSEFQIQALAEKDGALYATASSKADGFSVAVSTDAGSHWRPLLRLDELRGPLHCGALPAQCGDTWTQLKPSLGVLSGKPRESSQVLAVSAGPPAASAAGGGCAVGHAPDHEASGPLWLLASAALGGSAWRFSRRAAQPDFRRVSRPSNQENQT
jgi:hypothetical protein